MNTDRELLELAAKAYADPLVKPDWPHFTRWIGRNEDMGCDVFVMWNPLTDDGDALRLAVKLNMEIYRTERSVEATNAIGVVEERFDNSEQRIAATRRAIVRAAAEVGKGMLSHDEFVLMFPDRFEPEEVERARAAAATGEAK